MKFAREQSRPSIAACCTALDAHENRPWTPRKKTLPTTPPKIRDWSRIGEFVIDYGTV